MSLIHWWPLNGNLYDLVNGNHLTYINNNNKLAINNSGKLGKCYERTAVGTADLLRSAEPMKVFKEESICAWVYISQHAALGTANGVVTNHDHSANSGLGIGIYSTDGTNYYVSINAGNKSSRVHSSYWGNTNIKGAWHHVCLISDGSKIRMYVDGKEDREAVSYSVYSKADYLDIFNWSTGYYNQTNYRPACKVCDVRVYDHALSQAEVKELSKALAIHYSFNDTLAESTTNLVTGLVKGGRTTLDSTGKVITTNGENADTYFYLNLSKTLEAGKTYTISCTGENIIQNSGGSGEFFQFGLQGQGGVPQFKIYNGRSNATFTATATQAVNRLLLDDITGARCLTQSKFYDFQLEEKDHATPYTPTSRESMLVNEVGYVNPSSVIDFKLSTFSNNGSYSGYFDGQTSCIDTPVIKTNMFTEDYTLSFWVYPLDNGRAVYFGDHQLSSIPTINFERKADGTFRYYHNGSPDKSFANTETPQNTWTMLTVTYTPGTMKVYKNGTLAETFSHTASITKDIDGVMRIGRDNRTGSDSGATPFYGYISDFRFYVTCLSADDIQELYATRAYITDKDDMETHQFIEDCTSLQITNTYNVEARDMQEIGNEDYEQLEYIASTGTQYIDTGVYWTSEKATIVADLEVTTFKAATTLFGNEERYSGSDRYFTHIMYANTANGNYMHYIGTGSVLTRTLDKDTRYLINYSANGNKTVTISTTKVANQTTTTSTHNYNGSILTRVNSTQTAVENRGHIFIFSNHNAYNGSGPIQNVGGMKLYRFSMIQDDIYIRDFIPCRRKSDSKVGLFDMVTGQFYTSPVGNFTAGNVVTNEDTTVKFLSGGSIQARQFIEI